MPEIIIPVIPGLREVGNGATEAQAQTLEKLRQEHKLRLWAERGTEEECEASWRNFLLQDMPEGSVIY